MLERPRARTVHGSTKRSTCVCVLAFPFVCLLLLLLLWFVVRRHEGAVTHSERESCRLRGRARYADSPPMPMVSCLTNNVQREHPPGSRNSNSSALTQQARDDGSTRTRRVSTNPFYIDVGATRHGTRHLERGRAPPPTPPTTMAHNQGNLPSLRVRRFQARALVQRVAQRIVSRQVPSVERRTALALCIDCDVVTTHTTGTTTDDQAVATQAVVVVVATLSRAASAA